jgi:hypothetical protein
MIVEKKQLNDRNLFCLSDYSFYFKSALINNHLVGILKIIDKSSNILLLFDKNLITVSGELLNILKNIFGISLGCLFKTLKSI